MIRPAVLSDVPAMLAIYAPFVTDTAITFDISVPTLAEFTGRFRAVTAQFPWLVWEEDGRILGYAYGSAPFHRDAYQWCAEDSIYLTPEAQGKGIGKRLYQALEEILIRQRYQYLVRFPDCGFKDGLWHSVIWMEKRLNFVEKPIFPPISWQFLVNSTES